MKSQQNSIFSNQIIILTGLRSMLLVSFRIITELSALLHEVRVAPVLLCASPIMPNGIRVKKDPEVRLHVE